MAREVTVGIVPILSPEADAKGFHAFLTRAVEDARLALARSGNVTWDVDIVEVTRLRGDDPRRSSDFLDEATLRMVEGPYDFVIVVTDVGLVSRRHRVVAGLASRVADVAVMSTRKLVVTGRGEAARDLASEDVRWNATWLLVHLVGHLVGLTESRDPEGVMAPFRVREGLRDPPSFGPRERERFARLAERAPDREWVDAGPLRSVALHVTSALRHSDLVARSLVRNRAPLLALALPSLSTAALLPTLILVFTAEIWDVGLNLQNAEALGFAVASILAATWYLTHVQNLFFPRKEKRLLTEHMAVVNVTIFLTVLLAVIGLFAMVAALMLLIETVIFPPGLIATWPTLEDPVVDLVDKTRLAAFISTVSVLTGALGGGLESRVLIRHLALFEDRP